MALPPKKSGKRKNSHTGTEDAGGRVRCRAHMKWVRQSWQCAIAGAGGHFCTEDGNEAHHVKEGTDGGMGIKPGDNWTVPFCTAAHRELHDTGEAAFQARYGLDLKAMAADLWQASPHRKRYEKEQAA